MSNKLSYFSIGKTIDGTTFCSGVETLAENLIEDNEADATLIFPSATGWASTRSSSYRMTTENTEAWLPLPIYKINRILVNLDNMKFEWQEASKQEAYLSDFKNEAGESLSDVDITEFVVNTTEWQALPIAESGSVDAMPKYCLGLFKDNTFYWEQGSNKIPFLSTVYRQGTSILGEIFANNTPTYSRLVDTIFYRIGRDYKYKPGLVDMSLKSMIICAKTIDVRKWQFRIEYVPMTSKMKIRARKNAPTKVEYIQPFNQRAEINAASAFGKNMWLTAQKTGVREIKFIKKYPNIKKIPPLGALIRCGGRKYRLVAKHHGMTNHQYIQVTHMLSENWSERSKHVAVDQKYRNWSIPQETLWRNLYWEDYLRVGTSLKTSDNVSGGVSLADIMKGLYVSSTGDKTVDTFAWLTDENLGQIDTAQVKGATVPCSTYGIANSLIFSATFKDNLSAGLRAAKWDEEKGEFLCEEAMYCRADGTVSTARVVLSQGCGTSATAGIGENASNVFEAWRELWDQRRHTLYPSIVSTSQTYEGEECTIIANAPINPVFDKEFFIYKDPGEALKFTYQIHLIGEDDCLFGNKFAEYNPLIKDWKGANRKFKVWALKHYAREGSDILETISSDTAYNHSTDGACFTIAELEQTTAENKKYGEMYTLTLSDAVAAALQGAGCKAWAITDEKNNLYVACNDASVKTLYFQLHHKR